MTDPDVPETPAETETVTGPISARPTVDAPSASPPTLMAAPPESLATPEPMATPEPTAALTEPTAGPRPSTTPQPTGDRHGTCTTAQLRRFIKSRAYIPMHEIRRRFLIATEDDDVTGIDLGTSRIFVGLPDRESQMLGDLLRGGEVGYELQLDPVSPIVVGVYPMRPVTRG